MLKIHQRLSVCVIACSIVVLSGCTSESSKGTIKGKVTYQSGPVSGYDLNLTWKEKGFAQIIPVSDDGSFSAKDPLEAGTYTAYLSPKPPEPQPPGTPVKKTSVGKIPAKYQDPLKSDLKVTIKGGLNDVALDLKD